MNHKVLGLTVTAVAGASFFATAASAESVTVKSGDSLWKIANQYKVSQKALKEANQLKSDTIFAGQVLQIPGTGTQIKNASTEPHKESGTQDTYKVSKGDSLWLVARKYGMTVNELKTLNALKKDTIFLGQVLKINSNSNPVKPAVTPPAPPKTPVSEDKDTSSQNTYQVKPGDSLWKIANRFNLTIAELKVSNQLKNDTLYVNQVLKLKGEVKPESNPAPSAPDNSQADTGKTEAMINEAERLMGIPYKWAGNTPSGFDCSGFVYYVMNKVTSVSRLSAAGYSSIMKPVSEPERGDFVYFTTYKAGPSHMGIYLGNGDFIHASGSQGITVSNLSNSYWKSHYLGAKRYF
ncbi:LysM peptidoglycan-binding domain-containing protein [Metabacillus sp. KIGAM252]|uniref:LysM peptidoglycan-binding domain-containing protein n=1 Tax=Metabacillus flavus TaxID=2823519 RepID=A0ABS5LES1_9BACI|nr:peptidoglycan endopeptidase [Metabacillus flavus]MBS2969245.1 LysM peptidoglycan-binding domain-containing protein [Metabacillus flavus]